MPTKSADYRALGRALTPPVLWPVFHRLFPRSNALFSGSNGLFLEALSNIQVYGEYGLGESTKFVLLNTEAEICSVESDPAWVETIGKQTGMPPRLDMNLVNIGDIAEFGEPLTFSLRANFLLYAMALWDRRSDYDLVLIDGRFRIACFIACLMHGEPGMKIIFDDYVKRPLYHVVEEVLKPVTVDDRQALFVVPENIDREQLRAMLNEFALVIL